jgi:hypothetical protein
MLLLNMGLLQTFKKDLDIAAKNYIQNKTSMKQLVVLVMMVGLYTHLVPLMCYYKDRQKRIIKINKLKEDRKYVLDS